VPVGMSLPPVLVLGDAEELGNDANHAHLILLGGRPALCQCYAVAEPVCTTLT